MGNVSLEWYERLLIPLNEDLPTADLLRDELVINCNNVYPSHALGPERRSNERSRDADLRVDSIRVRCEMMMVVPLSWTVSARSGDVSSTFNGGRGFPGWIWAELRREAAVECVVCAASASLGR